MADISTSLINGYSNISSSLLGATTETKSGAESSFADVLSDALATFNETSAESNETTMDLLTGGTDDLSTPLVAAEKAEIALNLTIAIRNKAVDAYKEIMNMQI